MPRSPCPSHVPVRPVHSTKFESLGTAAAQGFFVCLFFFALAAVVVVVAVQVAGTEFGRACPLDPVGRLSI